MSAASKKNPRNNFAIYIVCFITFALPNAGVVKLVDTLDLGSSAARLGGSSPSTRTKTQRAVTFICSCFFSFGNDFNTPSSYRSYKLRNFLRGFLNFD